MAKKCARTFSIVVEKGKKSILEVRHLLPVGIARSVNAEDTASTLWPATCTVGQTSASVSTIGYQPASAGAGTRSTCHEQQRGQ